MGTRLTKTTILYSIVLLLLLLQSSIAAGQSCQDNDLDGYGNPGDASCSMGPESDCNDSSQSVNPGAAENCTDGIDNDCDGSIDYFDSECAQSYKFERMWPTLQQPWYFLGPVDVALDSSGSVFIVDTWNDRIQKFTSDGIFITKWGTSGSGNSQLDTPHGIGVGSNGDVYIADSNNNRIQKFSTNGHFVTKWGSPGNGDGQFNSPYSVAVAADGHVYVTDEGNHRVQKFDANGQFILTWGQFGTGNGEFNCPADIAIDNSGNVYVADYENHRIQQFTEDGLFIKKWGSLGSGDGQFKSPYGLAVDANGFIYVADSESNRIQKFSSEGLFISKWGSAGRGNGQFQSPYGIAANTNFLYIADYGNDRIQKFSTSGLFITKWGSIGTADGEFYYPYGIETDSSSNILVTDDGNHRVQKFSADGSFITKWGQYGTGDGEFDCPAGVAVDNADNVYVVDYGNNRIQKFSPTGTFISKWGSSGTEAGSFTNPYGITVDSSGVVYIADSGNHRIQKFSNDGTFIAEWGGQGTADGKFSAPHDLAVDSSGFIYVSDEGNNRVQKFSSDGTFITKWGNYGTANGQFNRPWGIDTDSSGFVYVTDGGNHRTQKFTGDGQFVTQWGSNTDGAADFSFPSTLAVADNGKVLIADVNYNRVQMFREATLSSKNKAIVMAAGGPYEGNLLWDATQSSANSAYQTLRYQGFSKEDIFYMSSDTDLDLDNNGQFDDVDSQSTLYNAENAITNWATDADNLIIYFVDHGGPGTLRVNSTEILTASDLDSWLDTAQDSIPGKIIIIYDACESGSFLPALTAPEGKERIVISSSSQGQSAYFVNQGSISFSNFFWTNIFEGNTIKSAFDMAVSALSQAIPGQTPLLDDNGNGSGNDPYDGSLAENTYIGNGTGLNSDIPQIGSASSDQIINGTASALLSAYNVSDSDGISRVWAVIIPPGFSLASTDNAVHGLPYVDLLTEGGNLYEAQYDQFNIEGTYNIAIYARDSKGNTSIPQLTTVSVNNPLRRRAIIVAGGDLSDSNWAGIEKGALSAYYALTYQGYTDEDIYFLSPFTFSTGIDGAANISNLSYAINTWASNDTWDLALYMVGNGGDKTFKINSTENLAAESLGTWLNNLQNSISGNVTVVYDASRAGSFLPFLAPPPDTSRILLSSTDKDESAYFISDGDISFSRYFWSRILNGVNIRDAFINAKQAMAFTSGQNQLALLDDNGNGLANETGDGVVSHNYTLGVGIHLAGSDPLIGSVIADQVLHGDQSLTLWADDVTSTGTIEKVWAVITPPWHEAYLPDQAVTTVPQLLLSSTGNNRFEGVYNGFTRLGTYYITIYAMDSSGYISTVKETTVQQADAPDIYEDDDSYSSANTIILNDPVPQEHNIHSGGDEDWVKFYGIAGQTYNIKASNLGSGIDAEVALYDTDGGSMIAQTNNPGAGVEENIQWTFELDGTYYVRVKHIDPGTYGENTEYDLQVYIPDMPLVFGLLAGTVSDGASGIPLGGVPVSTSFGTSYISEADGTYIMIHPPGTYSVSAVADGYSLYEDFFTIIGSETVTKNIPLTSLCSDNDGDNYGYPGNENCIGGASQDCNDSNSLVYPGAAEVCDGTDNNCDSVIDEGYPDTDNDGVKDCVDSDDDNDGIEDSSDSCPLQQPVRLTGTPDTYYSSLQEAYDNADENGTIQCQGTVYSGDFTANQSKTVTIEGGYECDYSSVNGRTTISGNITTSSGSVTFKDFSLEQ